MGEGEGFIITKETWENMPKEQRDWIMFETMQAMNEQIKALKKWNKCFSFAGGIIGGAMAAFGIKWWS